MTDSTTRLYILLACGLSWTVALVSALLGVELGTPISIAALLTFMAMPAVAATIAQRRAGRPLSELGLRLRFNRWLLVAWLLPVVWAVLTIGFSVMMPGVSFDNGASTLMLMLEQGAAPQESIEEVQAIIDMTGPIFPVLFFAGLMTSALIGGATINALAAFGEELGWRGLMQRDGEPLQFWRRSLFVGVIWGFWHAPIILMGHNYPDNPTLGVFVMVALTVLLSPMHTLVRHKSGTVLAPSILHGTINAIGGIVAIFISGGSTFTVGITGIGGFLAAMLINGVIWVYVSKGGLVSAEIPKQPIPTSAPTTITA